MTGIKVSLHRRITADVAARITSGAWKPGTRIPFEHELMTEYGCARMTVSKALGELARAGLIERRRRSGSFVASPRAESAVLKVGEIRAEVEATGLAYRWERLRGETRGATALERTALGLGPRARVLAVEGRHWGGAKPFCREARTISLAAVPEAAEADFAAEAPGPWLLSHVRWSAAEHRIAAAGADADAAQALDIAGGSPCLVVERRTWMDGARGQGVTLVRFTYPAEVHTLVARFTPAET